MLTSGIARGAHGVVGAATDVGRCTAKALGIDTRRRCSAARTRWSN